MRLATALAACVAAASARAQDSLTIHGKVVDQSGHPVVSAQITLAPGLRRATSFDEGNFEIRGVRTGTYTITARRIGYQAGSVSVFVRDSVTSVTVTLMAIPRELDSVRIREKASGLRYSAMVLDQNDQPVRDAEVVAVGVRGTMTTDSVGRFSVPGLDRGTLIVQIRKIGYARYTNSLRMLAERADTIYMARLPQTMTAVQINELGGFGMDYWAYRDMQQRQSWKSAMAGAVSREELAQHGKEDLCDALPGTASGVRLSLHNDPKCKSFPEGVHAILVDGVRCEHTLLSDFAADEVELVEVIPAGIHETRDPLTHRRVRVADDMSGSLAARQCTSPAPAYVVWTRRSPDLLVRLAHADSTLAADTSRSITGTVFDSIAQRPLGGARVHLADLNRDTVTDSVGVFRFDSVGAGVHGVWVDHPVLDTLGLYSLGERVDATAQRVSTAAIAIPSFGTLWSLACGTAATSRDGEGFVFGHVHVDDSTSSGSGTLVDMRWRAATGDSAGAARAVQRSVHPDSAGNYAICGVPDGRVVTLSVYDSSVTAIPVSFRTSERRIARRDLTLPSGLAFERLLVDSAAAPPAPVVGDASLTGMVRDSTGRAVRDARIVVSGMGGEWRADSSGKFVAHGVPAGAHVVTVSSLGFVRERRLMDIAPGDSATLDLSMTHLMTKLATVTIEERRKFDAVRADLEHRRKLGFGYRADSAEIAKLPGVGEAFNFPGVHTKVIGGQFQIYMNGTYTLTSKKGAGLAMTCNPTIWIDGFIVDITAANNLTKDEIGVIEAFTSAASAPSQYAGTRTNCGVVLIWRKRYISP